MKDYIIPFERLGMDDVARVGGKNASLGEMIAGLGNVGVRVPGGFATTADAYRDFLAQDGLDQRIREQLDALDADDTDQLSAVGSKMGSALRAISRLGFCKSSSIAPAE